MTRLLRKTELTGIVVIVLLGSALHFAFAWSGNWPPAGIFAAVNESVFEHLKLTFWPGVLYSAATWGLLRSHTKNFAIGKAAGLYAMPLTIVVLFYVYTAFTGTEILFVDILIFVVAVIAGQFASYGILKAAPLPAWLAWLSLALIVILGFCYGYFTFYPPHVPFFMDSEGGFYGIP